MVAFFIKALVALFTVVDPIGLVPIVLSLTPGFAPSLRAIGITRATLTAAGVMAFFGIFGQAIFAYLGVTSEAFSIAGGALLFLVAIEMLFGRLINTAQGQAGSLIALAAAAIVTLVAAWIAMRVSLQIQKRIGTTGILVVSRVLGMLLAAVAAQFILNGIAAFVAHPGAVR